MGLVAPTNLIATCGNPSEIILTWQHAGNTCLPAPYFSCSFGLCDEILKNQSKQYYLNNAVGQVTWSVSGAGASITQSGHLTTTPAACGGLTITAVDSCCGTFTQQVRVTDSGYWATIFQMYDGGHTGPTCAPAGNPCILEEVVVGYRRYYLRKIKTAYQPDGAVYNAYMAAGGLDCTVGGNCDQAPYLWGCCQSYTYAVIREWRC